MRLVLVDGSGFIFRAFHALPDMTRADGVHVNAVFGFCNMLARLLKEHTGTHIAVVFDAGRHTFRNRLYGEYKAHRPEPPPELVPQFALIREATRAFGVPAIELQDWEADDLIAAYAKAAVEAGGEAVIVSSDKDLMQLLRPGVEMLDPMKNTAIGLAEVEAKFGVTPEKVVEVQALIGDSTDNVPGVPGIGPKGAAALISEYGTLEAVLEAAPAMKPSKRRDALIEHADKARISKELVTLRYDAPLPAPLESFAVTAWDPAVLRAFLSENNFKSLRHRLGLEGEETEDAPPPISAAPFGPYAAMTSREALEAVCAQARATGLLAISVQTDDPASLHGNIVGLGLATASGEAAYLPLAHNLTLDDAPQLTLAEAISVLAPLLAAPGVLKIFHDAKYSLEVLHRAGLAEIAPLDDVMLISYAQDAGNFAHDAATLARVHLNHTLKDADSVTGSGRGRLAFANAPLDKAVAFAAEAADVSLRLWQNLKPMLRVHKSLALYELVEKRLIPVLADMEEYGVMVDRDDLAAMSTEFEGRMAEIETDIHRLAGQSFNVGSPKQLGEILFETMKLPGGKKGKTGAWGTDSSVLETLAEQGIEIAQRVMDWRQLAKLKSTYADALIGQIDPRTGRVHTSFQMAATSHRAALLHRPEPAEHTHKNAGRCAHPQDLHCSAGLQPDLGRLLADRTSPARACGQYSSAEGQLCERRGHPRPHRLRGVRRADGGHGLHNPPPREGDQFRHHLRHFRLRPGAAARHLARRGARVYRRLFQALSGNPLLHGRDEGAGACARLRAHPFRAALLGAPDQGQDPVLTRLCRTAGDQCAIAGRWRGHHQARHGEAAGSPARSRAEDAADLAGA